MLNKFIVQGRCTKDIQLKGNDNSKYVFFTIASKLNKEKTNFVDLKAFGKIAEIINKYVPAPFDKNQFYYVSKGTNLIAEGLIESSSFEKDGNKIFNQSLIVNNVYFNESKGASSDIDDKEPNFEEESILFN